jgi:hypothetical protein
MQFMTRKEVYDKVMTHLAGMSQPSVNSDGKCAYRGTGGRMCAVGCLIPDNVYNSGIEGTPVRWIGGMYLPGVDMYDEKLLAFIAMAQHVHDRHDKWRPHRKGMYAKAYNGLVKYAKELCLLGTEPTTSAGL